MPVVWNLKKWLAVEHDIYRPSELQALLAEKAGVRLSLQAVSTLLNSKPCALRLQTMQVLCNTLQCNLSDFCEVSPDSSNGQQEPSVRATPTPVRLYGAKEQKSHSEQTSSGKEELATRPDVDAPTREIILRILEEQGLVPRANRLGPATNRSQLIGMLIPTGIWPLISDLTRGIVEVITQTPYDLVLYSIKDEDLTRDRSEVIDRLLATQLSAGLLAVFPDRASQHLTQLYQQGFPVVIVDDQKVQTTPWVGADNTTGAYMAVRTLSTSAIGVLHTLKDLPSISSHRIAIRGIVKRCSKWALLQTPLWCWKATSCRPVDVPALADCLNWHWKNGLPPFLLQATRWPSVYELVVGG